MGHLLGIFKKFFLKNRSNPGKRELTLIYPALWAKPCGGDITFLNSPNTENMLTLNIYLQTVLSVLLHMKMEIQNTTCFAGLFRGLR